MDKQNICNFNFNRSSDLICELFVYEKNGGQAVAKVSPYYELGFVIRGKGTLKHRNKCYELSEGTLFLVCRGESFCVTDTDISLEYCYICFHGRRAEELMERLCISVERCVFEGMCGLADFWLHCLTLVEKENVDMLSEAVLLYSLARLKPAATEQSDLISKMVSLTSEKFSSSDFNLIRLATIIGYDEKYLSSVFKRQKGITYSAYLRELRISRAVFLMEQGLVSVKNISILSGFSDPLYFSKVFKQTRGVTPKEYINSIAERSSQDKRSEE